MNKTVNIIVAFFLFICANCFKSLAQANVYNLNETNGLPANHVYGTIEDHFGYLWISTENGVVKYNGYECRTFNENDGIVKSDIYQTFEDSTGKIWLGSMASEMGYIFQDEYHKVKFFDDNRKIIINPPMIYPTNFEHWGKNVAFLTPYVSNKKMPNLCINRNDTVFIYECPDSILNKHTDSKSDIRWKIRNNKSAFLIVDGIVYSVFFNAGKPVFNRLLRFPNGWSFFNSLDFGKYLLHLDTHFALDSIGILSVVTGKSKNIHLNLKDKSFEEFSNVGDSIARIIGKKYVYDFDIRKNAIVNVELNSKSSTKVKYDVWTHERLTAGGGLNLTSSSGNEFIRQNFSLENYSFLNYDLDGNIYWGKIDSVAVFDKNNKLLYSFYSGIKRPSTLYCLNQDYSIISSKANGSYLFNRHTKRVYPFIRDFSSDIFAYDHSGCIWVSTVVGLCKMFFNLSTLQNSKKLNFESSNSSYTNPLIQVNETRYHSLLFVDEEQVVYAASLNSIVRIRQASFDSLPLPFMKREGIRYIKKLLYDSASRTFFLQSYNKIFIYNTIQATLEEVFTNYKLDNAKIGLHNNTIYCLTKAGIFYSKIIGHNKLGNYESIINPKGTLYNRVFDFSIGDSNILLSTEKGIYIVKLQNDSNKLTESANKSLRFYHIYRNETIPFNGHDTIVLDHNDLNLKFDVINPNGIGQLSQICLINGKKIISKNCEINLNSLLTPGKFTDVDIVFYDNVWKSETMHITLLLHPFWWEKIIYSRFNWLWAIILLLLLLIPTTLFTRKWVNKINARRVLNQEIEIKAIYSQINPHFIFNSLNTALYLISEHKTDSAFNHVNRFSKLLRAYLSSSRNKFITLSAEIENINNYVQLQQIRFTDLFDFELRVDEKLSPSNIKIPSLILQPLVENAINHGLFHLKERRGLLLCEFQKDETNGGLICIIDDNGIGREAAKSITENRLIKKESFGSVLISELISIFNKYERMKISIEYFDKTLPERGTKVILKIGKPISKQ